MNLINTIRLLWHQIQPLIPYLSLFLSCVCFYYLKKQNRPIKNIVWIVYSLILIFASYKFIHFVSNYVSNPGVWDFTAFYLWGKTAVAGHNVYSPENLRIVFNSLSLPLLDYSDFIKELVNIGFLYPPPTILLFAPLGFLSYKTALVCWTVFNSLFAIGSIYLIYDLFFKKYRLNGLMLVVTLFLLSLPVRYTFFFSQTSFILLFLLLLMKKYSDNKISGIFLVLAIFTKPYMIIFGLIFLLKKQWNTIAYAIVTLFLLIGITLLIFGTAPFISYLFDNPSRHLPNGVFSESINQSLQAVLLRQGLITMNNSYIYIYIIIGAFLLTLSYLFYLIKRKYLDYTWAVLLLVGLMLYPGTLSHYGVLLLFIIFQFFDEKNQLGLGIYLTIPIILISFYLSSVSLFAYICFLLIIIVLKSFNLLTFGFSKT